ncbi:MAG: RNA 3'-terminal phosphate cyclase [Kiloniellales bacterium]
MDLLVVDGSRGEGGGQILRTALALAAVTGRPLRVERIRAGRPNPGLAAQHLTGVRAAAALCAATVEGDAIGSQTLTFAPGQTPAPGHYVFDVAAVRPGGSAGAVTLVLHTVLLPLVFATGQSTVAVHGGTHVAWSPSVDYVGEVWLPTLARMGVEASLDLVRWGWYPVGRGQVQVHIRGRGGATARLEPLDLRHRGGLRRVRGRAVVSHLPGHIAERMARHARSLLAAADVQAHIQAALVDAACPGAGLFLTAEYASARAGFGALGSPGKRAEAVAAEAVAALMAHRASGAAFDAHLADQMIVPLALAGGQSVFTTERVSRHLVTNAWVVEQFGVARVSVAKQKDGTGLVTIRPSLEA